MKIILKINDVDLSKSVISDRLQSDANGGSVKTTMQLVLQADAEALRYIDLRGRVKVGAVHEEQHHPVFGGFINFGFPEGSSYELQCTDASQLLEEAKAGGGFGSGLLLAEIIY